MIRIADLIEWAKKNAFGRDITITTQMISFNEGYISAQQLRDLADSLEAEDIRIEVIGRV